MVHSDFCKRCGKATSFKVQQFSIKKYGIVYCFDCQNGKKQALGNDPKPLILLKDRNVK